MAMKLRPETLKVQSFSLASYEPFASVATADTAGRDCTYAPVCPSTAPDCLTQSGLSA